jgi:RNA polymerase sigma-70 factor (ECF subfamily)
LDDLTALVQRAQAGDLDAFGRLVAATQRMAYAAAKAVLREPALAEDATQDAYLRAFRRLPDLDQPGAFIPWLRRIVISVALNLRRSHRVTFLQLDDAGEIPVLDEAEFRWSDEQRRRLAAAFLVLTPDERRLCDRRYHGQWSVARLAADMRLDEAVIRKRLQRVRDKLRKEIEVSEQRGIRPGEVRADLPAKVVELLARPKLTDLPENPVGRMVEDIRSAFPGFTEIDLPETVDFAAARGSVLSDAVYIEPEELHRIDDRHILRYDLTLPLFLQVRYEGEPLRLWSVGKTYRAGKVDAQHLEAFHQFEVFALDERTRLDPWQMTARVLRSVNAALPGRTVKIVPTKYAMCSEAWELEVEDDGRWSEVMAWGVYTDRIVRHLGADPATHTAMGVGYGLERFAMVRYEIDDIRKVDVIRVA